MQDLLNKIDRLLKEKKFFEVKNIVKDENAADLAVTEAQVVDPFDARIATCGGKNPAPHRNACGAGGVKHRTRRLGQRNKEGEIDSRTGRGEKAPPHAPPARSLLGGGKQGGRVQPVGKGAFGFVVGGGRDLTEKDRLRRGFPERGAKKFPRERIVWQHINIPDTFQKETE